MQKILGYVRRAVQEFDLLEDGDRIAVGVSGGKDSLVLLKAMVLLRRFIGIDYEVVAITLDPRFGGEAGDYGPVAEMCRELGIEYVLVDTHIGEIVFDVRKEPNPCSLCARMRRGALHDAAKANGCNKIALGHNYNDVVETFVMNLTIEGRLGCFSPKSYLSRKDITMIRPLVFAPEKEISRAARKNDLPIVKSKCPADKHTSREKIKLELAERDRADKGFSDRLFGALRRSGLDGWGFKDKETPCSDKAQKQD
ncbi:MAG: tRNA 2-thiocytidine biosynthesis protein TtcA [Oscillospiraceae bacterium]|nr:tRNA 2-thiocytidine biosynthesis protein TtcA [Oscillospiraceae bacterium]